MEIRTKQCLKIQSNTKQYLFADTPRRVRKGSGSEPGQWPSLETGMWRRTLKKGWRALSCIVLLTLPADTFSTSTVPCGRWNQNPWASRCSKAPVPTLELSPWAAMTDAVGSENFHSESMRCWGCRHISNKHADSHHHGPNGPNDPQWVSSENSTQWHMCVAQRRSATLGMLGKWCWSPFSRRTRCVKKWTLTYEGLAFIFQSSYIEALGISGRRSNQPW